MAAPVTPILIGLMAWGVYRRVRRNIGQQPLRPTRIIVSLVVLALVTGLLIVVSLPFPKMLMGIGGGMGLGAGLGFVGLRLTKFETTDQGHFFTPNTHIGIALSLVDVPRYGCGHDCGPGADFSKSADLFDSGADARLLFCLSNWPVRAYPRQKVVAPMITDVNRTIRLQFPCFPPKREGTGIELICHLRTICQAA